MTETSRRILVTGSRDWDNLYVIEMALDRVVQTIGWDLAAKDIDWNRKIILVSGACPTGADKMAEDIWNMYGHPVERHPADWSKGRQAGYERNAEMVKLGADICLAFIKNNSKGATMTADLAEKAGIETRRYRASNIDWWIG